METIEKQACLHCGAVHRVDLMRRGLCRTCYAEPANRRRYVDGRAKRRKPRPPAECPPRPPCRHCGRRASRPRGLCNGCYNTTKVRQLYPSESKFCPHRNVSFAEADFYGDRDPAATPTEALPGTIEKLSVLAERFAAGVSLWHPADARRLVS